MYRDTLDVGAMPGMDCLSYHSAMPKDCPWTVLSYSGCRDGGGVQREKGGGGGSNHLLGEQFVLQINKISSNF